MKADFEADINKFFGNLGEEEGEFQAKCTGYCLIYAPYAIHFIETEQSYAGLSLFYLKFGPVLFNHFIKFSYLADISTSCFLDFQLKPSLMGVQRFCTKLTGLGLRLPMQKSHAMDVIFMSSLFPRDLI